MLDLRLLHQAATLARYRNFARAAAALHITQPALSRNIASLEGALGEKLFHRSRQGVEPTAFGELLLARGRALLEDATALEREFRRMRGLEVGEVRVGAGPYPAELSVGEAVGRLLDRHPRLRVDVTVGDLRELGAALLEGKLDLVVAELSLAEGEPRIATEPLPAHAGVFYCRAGHPLLAEPAPALERVLAFPYAGTRLPPRIAKAFLALAKAGAIDPSTGDYLPPVKVDSIRTAREVVLASDAVSAAPLPLIAAEIDAGRLAALPLRLPWLKTGYGLVYLRDRPLSPAAEALAAEVRRVEAELVAETDRLQPVPAPARGARTARKLPSRRASARSPQ
ncbi:MAG: LysR family transcriptional regulator [Burkholderiales bacterium]|nr:LysR family transcriptional regulator [Burkholderiales bacterium]